MHMNQKFCRMWNSENICLECVSFLCLEVRSVLQAFSCSTTVHFILKHTGQCSLPRMCSWKSPSPGWGYDGSNTSFVTCCSWPWVHLITFLLNLTQARIIREEGPSSEEMTPLGCPEDKPVGHFLDWQFWRRSAKSTAANGIPEQSRRSKPVINVPSWSLLQFPVSRFLPWVSALTCLHDGI